MQCRDTDCTYTLPHIKTPHLIDAWRQQLHNGEVLARALHYLSRLPVVK